MVICLQIDHSERRIRQQLTPRPLLIEHIMKIFRFVAALLLVPSASMLLAQTPAPARDPAPPPSTEPPIVDVHPSPYRAVIWYRTNIGNQRFDMRDASILDLISLAYRSEEHTSELQSLRH